ncbi:type I-C CRISPR-associated protein Cas5c [Desulfonema magnum]|uniref:pre-crRNA processing endonuclease n=1 Tax=Desulfonema magnum TaxID=45655 RepID=A0A975BYE6_9BACT|nr:type I-C CRISPR-associated protein Cas5c [Desulfonema magnum]QTA93782.1 CRISPR-associated protein Cas5, subtype I-C/DVULG [Desulfonema magnum]
MSKAVFDVKIGGDFACFTNPALKVERCSYPMITPGAARGVLESIFWKPEIRFEIRQIKVLKPIKQISIMRNEIKDRQTKEPIVIEKGKQRQQRGSLILKDVEYVIRTEIIQKAGRHSLEAYKDQFQRKLEKGQYHHTPYLGTREFAAWFEPADGSEEAEEPVTLAIGRMLFDIAYCESAERAEIRFHRRDSKKEKTYTVKGYAHALYFDAILKNNVLEVPREKYNELYELEGNHV